MDKSTLAEYVANGNAYRAVSLITDRFRKTGFEPTGTISRLQGLQLRLGGQEGRKAYEIGFKVEDHMYTRRHPLEPSSVVIMKTNTGTKKKITFRGESGIEKFINHVGKITGLNLEFD